MGHKAIALLPTEALPAVVAVVVGRAAVLPVVGVVGTQVGVDPALPQDLHAGTIKGFQRAPAAVQEIVFSGVQFPAGRHTGQASRVEVLEPGAVLFQPPEVGQPGPVAAVVRQELPGEGIKHYHDRSHKSISSLWKIAYS